MSNKTLNNRDLAVFLAEKKEKENILDSIKASHISSIVII